jgi:hypothetical protein
MSSDFCRTEGLVIQAAEPEALRFVTTVSFGPEAAQAGGLRYIGSQAVCRHIEESVYSHS